MLVSTRRALRSIRRVLSVVLVLVVALAGSSALGVVPVAQAGPVSVVDIEDPSVRGGSVSVLDRWLDVFFVWTGVTSWASPSGGTADPNGADDDGEPIDGDDGSFDALDAGSPIGACAVACPG